MAKAQEDFRCRDVSLASWQWEQWMSCFFQPPSLTKPITFPLAFPGERFEFIFVMWLVVGFCSLAFFFFIWSLFVY